jgi:hypothetical protein
LVAEKLYGDRLKEATHDHIPECVTWAMDNPDKGIYGLAKWLLNPEKVEHISGSQCYYPSGNHFIAHWPLEKKIDGLDDLRVFWSWYARDDGGPFVKKLVMRRGGIYRTIQHKNKVLALYQPKENITYNDQYELLNVACYNYRGEKRVFPWDELPRIRNGFAFEIAGKREYRDFGAFLEHLGEARVTDVVEGNEREATFTSSDTSLLLRYDPAAAGSNTKFLPYQPGDTASIKRQINGNDIDYSHFRSTCAILSTEPEITVGNATLTRQTREPIWLIKDPADENYAVWNFSGKTISFALQTPQGQITANDFHLGRLLVKGGTKPTVEVEQLPDHQARITHDWRK